MGRPRRRVETVRCNLSFPVADKKTKAWLDAQKCSSDSMRYLIQAYIRVYGYTDPILSFPEIGPVQAAPQGPETTNQLQAQAQAVPDVPAPQPQKAKTEPVFIPAPAPAPIPIPAPPAPVSPPSSGSSTGNDIVAKFFD